VAAGRPAATLNAELFIEVKVVPAVARVLPGGGVDRVRVRSLQDMKVAPRGDRPARNASHADGELVAAGDLNGDRLEQQTDSTGVRQVPLKSFGVCASVGQDATVVLMAAVTGWWGFGLRSRRSAIPTTAPSKASRTPPMATHAWARR
jgi:hypothetical protein